MIKYNKNENGKTVLADTPCDGYYVVDGNRYRYWCVEFKPGYWDIIGEYDLEDAMMDDDGNINNPIDDEITFYASYDDDLDNIYSIIHP